MSPAWLDKLDNPGMTEWTLQSADLYGGIILINVARRRCKVGLIRDFKVLQAAPTVAELADIAWLAERP